ncbi:MAG: RagB/SusD family nutrient uptake outer membrane protein [Tannerellaceae bacterium]|nr:RagB/SusD family nutrient uptake outer membrane protein [Tannerellaceae bacterium]
MKKIKYITLLFAGLLFYSCDLDTIPTEYVDKDYAFSDVENVEYVLNGTWSYLFDTYSTYQNPGWSCVLLASDAMANDAALQPGKYGYLAHYQYTNMNSNTATSVSAVWTFAYKTIDNTNNIIHYIDEVEGDESEKQRIKAQAKALRGYIYLNLATFYAPAYAYDPEYATVPVYTEPTNSSTEGKAKSKLSAVYDRAEEDLLDGYEQLEGYTRNHKYQFDQQVVAGLLARLYLQKEEWKKAQEYAALAHTGYSWMTRDEYVQGFNENNNSEWIWGHGQQKDQATASYSFHFRDVSSSSSYYYSFMADPWFKEFFDEQDIRYQLFEWDTSRFKGGLMYKKFLFRSDLTGDIVLMRKAEQVLIEAEAYAELNEPAKAIEKLNELRNQRGALTPDLSTLTKEELIEEILIERRKELFGEGFGLSDIKRRQKSVERKSYPETKLTINGVNITVQGHTTTRISSEREFRTNDPYYNFVIPDTETTNNPNLDE